MPGVLSPPTAHPTVLSLDAILAQCNSLFARANTLLSDRAADTADLEDLQLDAVALH